MNARCPSRATSLSSSSQTYWAVDGEHTIVSHSQGVLRDQIGATLDEGRLALALCSHLPGVLRRRPFWHGIHAMPVGCRVDVETAKSAQHHLVTVDDHVHANGHETADRLTDALDRAMVRRTERPGGISCDLSGGMDSTSLAYLLAARNPDGVYYHARTEDARNHDSSYALRAAEELGGRFVELESFTSSIAAFSSSWDDVADDSHEGPWSWGSNASHLRHLLEDAAARGVRTHLNGLGGDELFGILPTLALALRDHGEHRRSLRAIHGMARAQRWNLASTFRAAWTTESWATEVRRRVGGRVRIEDSPEDAFGWAPGFAPSPYMTSDAIDRVITEIDDAIAAGADAWFADKHRHQVLESVLFQGEVVRQMNHAFGHLGVAVEAPLLDDEIVAFILGLPPRLLAGGLVAKPLLAAATRDVVPQWVFTRPDKGEYSTDFFGDLRRRRGELRSLFTESYLVDHGYVDANRIRRELDAPMVNAAPLFALEQLASVERWSRRNA